MVDKRHSYFKSELKTRAEGEQDRYIDGYFAVFEQETELWQGLFEKLARGAFDNSIKNNDIRCLFNHDSGFVLGRFLPSPMGTRTLELKVDDYGLYGSVKMNANDRQAMDIYARVERGDISGCSFGFNPIKESSEERADGWHYTVEEADTHEVSICTFPAYPQTEIQARQNDFKESQKRNLEQRKTILKNRLENIKNGTETT